MPCYRQKNTRRKLADEMNRRGVALAVLWNCFLPVSAQIVDRDFQERVERAGKSNARGCTIANANRARAGLGATGEKHKPIYPPKCQKRSDTMKAMCNPMNSRNARRISLRGIASLNWR